MEQLELLGQELKAMQDNIARILKYREKNWEYKPNSSRVFGELKHRSICLKQRLTEINKISTKDLF